MIRNYGYVTIHQWHDDPDKMYLGLTTMGRDEVLKLRNEGKMTDDEIMWYMFYDSAGTSSAGGNGWTLFYANEIGNLSEAPCLSDDACIEDDGSLNVGVYYYFPEYQIRSMLDEIINNNYVKFIKA